MRNHWGRKICFSEDGELFASTQVEKILIWRVMGNQIQKICTRDALSPVRSIAFRPGKSRNWLLASGNHDGSICLWRRNQKKPIYLRGDKNSVLSLAFSPDGKILASASKEKTMRLWDIESQKNLAIYRDYSSSVNAVSFSPDGKKLASGDDDGNIYIWPIKKDSFFEKANVVQIKHKVQRRTGFRLIKEIMVPLRRQKDKKNKK